MLVILAPAFKHFGWWVAFISLNMMELTVKPCSLHTWSVTLFLRCTVGIYFIYSTLLLFWSLTPAPLICLNEFIAIQSSCFSDMERNIEDLLHLSSWLMAIWCSGIDSYVVHHINNTLDLVSYVFFTLEVTIWLVYLKKIILFSHIKLILLTHSTDDLKSLYWNHCVEHIFQAGENARNVEPVAKQDYRCCWNAGPVLSHWCSLTV